MRGVVPAGALLPLAVLLLGEDEVSLFEDDVEGSLPSLADDEGPAGEEGESEVEPARGLGEGGQHQHNVGNSMNEKERKIVN